MFKRTLFLAALAVFAGPTDPARAGGKNVAIIDYDDLQPLGPGWCEWLIVNGHTCTVFPSTGPTGPLDPFDVVIDLSLDWSDPTGMLADCMRAGKTVITWYIAPAVLGVRTNPTVQAWIGATWDLQPSGALYSTALDPILGDVPVGTELATCADGPCAGLTDAPGHPFAKVLARFEWPYPQPPPIGIMRNYWEGGVSVYLANVVRPGSTMTSSIFLNAVEARNIIPALNGWGLLALAVGVCMAGVVVMRRRRSLTRSGATLPALLAIIFAACGSVQAQVTMTQQGAGTELRLGEGEPFHNTDKTVANLKSVTIPNSSGIAVLWEEIAPDGSREPFYAVSLDGTNVDEVRATSYDLQLRYAGFDPAVGEPAIPSALMNDSAGKLYIVQFVTQSLSAFRAGVESQGATLYDFLPNHAHIARIPGQARPGVAALPFVRAVVPYHPAYRLEEFLRDNLDRSEQLFPLQRYNIRVFAAGQKTAVAARIAETGGLVDSADAGKRMVEATLTPAQLLQVIRWDEVLFVNRWGPMEPDMDIVRKMPLLPDGSDGGANYLQAVAGYRGSGVRGEVYDVGFNTSHQDFGSPVVGELVCPVAREWPIEHGAPVGNDWHGAATSGIIFGNGKGNPNARGLLPCGQTIVATWNNIGFSGGNRYWHTCELVKCACCPTDPPDPNCTPDPNCPYQAVFQSTSGGSPETLDYDPDMDDILFDFDLVHCQAQGNKGSQLSRPQAWAKNTISVGGVKHFNDTATSNDRWCYGANICGTVPPEYCASIGPAADGRVKPDLAGFFDCIETVSCCPYDSCYYCYTSGFVSYTVGFTAPAPPPPSSAVTWGCSWRCGPTTATATGRTSSASRWSLVTLPPKIACSNVART